MLHFTNIMVLAISGQTNVLVSGDFAYFKSCHSFMTRLEHHLKFNLKAQKCCIKQKKKVWRVNHNFVPFHPFPFTFDLTVCHISSHLSYLNLNISREVLNWKYTSFFLKKKANEHFKFLLNLLVHMIYFFRDRQIMKLVGAKNQSSELYLRSWQHYHLYSLPLVNADQFALPSFTSSFEVYWNAIAATMI